MPPSLCRSRLHPLPKASGGLRPIAISEVVQRLLAKIVAARVQDVTRARLSPFQLGIGVPDPTVAISAYLGAALHCAHELEGASPVWLMKVDIKSAFTMASRDAIFRATSCWGERVGKWFRFLYEHESLLFSQGDEMAEIFSETGVRQGDPLSSMAFCLVLDPALRAAADVGERVAPLAEVLGVRLAPIVSYHDDTYILSGTKAGLRARFGAFRRAAAKVNLGFQIPKCWYFCSCPGEGPCLGDDDEGEGFAVEGREIPYRTLVDGGMELLGAAIGGVAFASSHFTSLVQDALEIAKASLHLSMQSFLIAMRQCVVPKLMHAVRSSEYIPLDVLKPFDLALRELICDRLALGPYASLSPDARSLIDLPIRLGGLGITPLAGVGAAAVAGAIISLVSVGSGLPDIFATDLRRLLASLAGTPADTRVCCLLSRALDAFSRLDIAPSADYTTFSKDAKALPISHTQHALWDSLLEPQAEKLAATASPFLRKVLSATVAKKDDRITNPGSAWLTCYPAPLFRISDRAFRLSVLERLGLSDGLDERELLVDNRRPGCPLCSKPLADGHFFDCDDVSRFEIQRHDAVTSLLFQMCLKTRSPVVMEMTHSKPAGAPRDSVKRPDLTVAWPARVGARDPAPSVRHHVDVVTANVFAVTYDRYSREGALANHREEGKRRDYQSFMREHPREVFHPFGVTHMGQLGDGAKLFLKTIKERCVECNVSFSLKWWLTRLSVTLVRFASWTLDSWTEHAAKEVGRRRAALKEPALMTCVSTEDTLLTSA